MTEAGNTRPPDDENEPIPTMQKLLDNPVPAAVSGGCHANGLLPDLGDHGNHLNSNSKINKGAQAPWPLLLLPSVSGGKNRSRVPRLSGSVIAFSWGLLMFSAMIYWHIVR